MEYELTKQKIKVAAIAFSGCKEQAVDADLTMPDYCADIKRVLKCKINPLVNSKSINGDVLEIDGTSAVTVFYTGEDGDILHCFEHNIPFNTRINVKNIPASYIILTTAETEYVNCRALSQRRIDIHGAFSICAKVICPAEKEITADISGTDARKKTSQVTVAQLKGLGENMFSISGENQLSPDSPTVENVLKKDVCIIIDDIKCVPDKVMVNGTAKVKLMYVSDIENSTRASAEYTVPFNKIFDAEGADENCKCTIVPCVSNIGIQIDNENKTVETDIKLSASVMAFDKDPVTLLADTYSTKHDMSVQYENTVLPLDPEQLKTTFSYKTTVPATERNIDDIIDVWQNCAVNLSISSNQNSAAAQGKISFNILAVTEENEIVFIEKCSDISVPIDTMQENCCLEGEIYACAENISAKLDESGNIDIKCDILLQGVVYCLSDIKTVCAATYDESSDIDPKKSPALTVYYADDDESLWEICKKHRVSPEAVLQENNLNDNDKLKKGILLLPSK